MADLTLPGFDVVEMLGYGSGGEVWLARELSSGDSVALKRLRPGADLGARDRLRREAAVLAGVEHPHLVRLRTVVGTEDAMVLVLDLAPGGSLARLLSARGTLTPGEVVTVAVPLGQALGHAHARGLVHGDVTPANVLFAADGRPLLSDLGVSRLLGEGPTEARGTVGFVDPAVLAGAPVAPSSDVHGLAATCLAALTGRPPYDEAGVVAPPVGSHPVLDVLRRVLAAPPSARPGAADFARQIWECAPAEPVRLGGAAAVGTSALGRGTARNARQPVTHRVSRPAPPPEAAVAGGSRRAVAGRLHTGLTVLAGASAVTLAAVTGIAWAGAGDGARAGDVARPQSSGARPASPGVRPASPGVRPPGPSPRAAVPTAPSGPWAAVLDRLDATRSAAFAAATPDALGDVYVAGSAAMRRDRAALRRLARAGLRAEGLSPEPVSVSVRDQQGSTVRLTVTDVLPGYRLVDRDGAVVQQRAGRGEVRWTVTLRRVGGRWLVYDVARG